ncbi:MAG: hypothetical protein EBZ49_00150 [Proteobacteria bacterium]|nr:hypothetical protein [Pseudomonadota bacterium]
MITLKWQKYPGSTVGSFKIYRSIMGFMAPLSGVTYGATLILKINGKPQQTVTFEDDPVADINAAITGGKAFLSNSGTHFIFRSDIRQAPGSVEIVGGTAMGPLGLTARLITQTSEDTLVATLSDTTTEYTDLDGVLCDYYAISTVTDGVESDKSGYQRPIEATGPICVIEGTITNLQGTAASDVEVKATIQVPTEIVSGTAITLKPITTRTDKFGKFSLPLLQKALIKLEIPDIGFMQLFKVPEQTCVFLSDLVSDEDAYYPIGYRGAT